MCGVKLELDPKNEENEEKQGQVSKDRPSDVALFTGQGGNCTLLQTANVRVSRSDGTFVTAQIRRFQWRPSQPRIL